MPLYNTQHLVPRVFDHEIKKIMLCSTYFDNEPHYAMEHVLASGNSLTDAGDGGAVDIGSDSSASGSGGSISISVGSGDGVGGALSVTAHLCIYYDHTHFCCNPCICHHHCSRVGNNDHHLLPCRHRVDNNTSHRRQYHFDHHLWSSPLSPPPCCDQKYCYACICFASDSIKLKRHYWIFVRYLPETCAQSQVTFQVWIGCNVSHQSAYHCKLGTGRPSTAHAQSQVTLQVWIGCNVSNQSAYHCRLGTGRPSTVRTQSQVTFQVWIGCNQSNQSGYHCRLGTGRPSTVCAQSQVTFQVWIGCNLSNQSGYRCRLGTGRPRTVRAQSQVTFQVWIGCNRSQNQT